MGPLCLLHTYRYLLHHLLLSSVHTFFYLNGMLDTFDPFEFFWFHRQVHINMGGVRNTRFAFFSLLVSRMDCVIYVPLVLCIVART